MEENDNRSYRSRVKSKKKTKGKANLKEKSRKSMLDVLIIIAKGEISYAERDIQICEAVTRIRKSQKGDLLRQLNGNSDKSDQFMCAVGDILGESALVRISREKSVYEVRDTVKKKII